MGSVSSKVVEKLNHDPKFQGLNPGTTVTVRQNGGKIFANIN
jgi:hypothetical protein